MKRPSFQFYPGDWLEEIGLRASSLAARGLWADVLCYMHQGEPYGHLRKNGQDIGTEQLARMVGASRRVVDGLLAELERHHVFSRTDAGTIYSRRQVRDEALREVRAAGGPKGAGGGLKAAENPNASRSGEGRKGGRPSLYKGGKQPPSIPPIEPPPSSPSPSPSPSAVSGDVTSTETDMPAPPADPPKVKATPALGTIPIDEERPWNQTACEHWIRLLGPLPKAFGARITTALRPLIGEHGWHTVEPLWIEAVEDAAGWSDPGRFAPETFARTFTARLRQKGGKAPMARAGSGPTRRQTAAETTIAAVQQIKREAEERRRADGD